MENPEHLFAPPEFWRLTADEKAKICNGCGARSALIDFVPDSILGLDISRACDIHDYTWYIAEPTWDDFNRWNLVFFNNIVRIINHHTRWAWLRWLRRRRALTYYQAVEEFGKSVFWDGKNKPEELGLPQNLTGPERSDENGDSNL